MARAEHDAAGAARPLVPSVDLSGPPPVDGRPATGWAPGPATRGAAPVTPPGRVDLRLPADPAYLSVLRTTAAALAARLDLSVDEVEDLRIAVDEAASLLLATADAGHAEERSRRPPGEDAVLEASFDVSPERLVVEVRGPARHLPERGAVAWAVLEALVGEVRTDRTPQGSAIRLVHVTGGPA
ncbi:hypothetical protein GCM10009756_30360 [Pseudokineococcus marinus]